MDLNDMILISVDDHLVEPPSMSDYFADHFPAKYRDRVPRVITRDDGTDAWLIEGTQVDSFGLNAVAGRVREEWGMEPGNFTEVRKGTWDVHERVRDMDANGVLGSMCFSSWPGLGGQYFLQSGDRELAGEMIRAYNDWHIEEWPALRRADSSPSPCPASCSARTGWQRRSAGWPRRGATPSRSTPTPTGSTTCPTTTARSGTPLGRPAWTADSVMVLPLRQASPLCTCRAPPSTSFIHTMPFNTGVFASELHLVEGSPGPFPYGQDSLWPRAASGWMPYWLERADYTYERHHPLDGPGLRRRDAEPPLEGAGCSACFIDDYTGLRNR